MPLPKRMRFSIGVKECLQATSVVAKTRTETSTGSTVIRNSNMSGLFRRKSSSSDSDSVPTANWKLPPMASPLKLGGIDEPKKRRQKGSVSWDPNIVEKKKERSQPVVIATTSAVSMDTQDVSSPEEMEFSTPPSPSKAIEAPNVLISTIEVHEEEQAPVPMDKRDELVMPSTETAETSGATQPRKDELNSLLTGCFSEETQIAARVADKARLAYIKRVMGAEVEAKERC